MRPPKTKRNKALVHLRKLNPKHYTYQTLGYIFGMSKESAYRIYQDNKEIPLPEWVNTNHEDYPQDKVK